MATVCIDWMYPVSTSSELNTNKTSEFCFSWVWTTQQSACHQPCVTFTNTFKHLQTTTNNSGPTKVFNPNGISIGSAVFVWLTTVKDSQTYRQTNRPWHTPGKSFCLQTLGGVISADLLWETHLLHFLVHGQVTIRPYFRSVCLSVCLCRVFLSRLWSDFDQTRSYVICLGLVVSRRI